MLDRDVFSPILESASLKDFAFERIREAILRCDLRPGGRVTESGLADAFGIGKASIRNALSRLSMQGLVEPAARRGWRITPVTGRLAGDIIGLRRRLEPSLGALRLERAVIDELHGLAGVTGVRAAWDDPAAWETLRRYDRSFMERLAALSDNMLLSRWLGQLWDRSDQISRFLTQNGAGYRDFQDRTALVDALAQRDSQRAEIALFGEIDRFENWVARALLRNEADLGAAHPPTAGRRSAAPRMARKNREKIRTDSIGGTKS